MDVEVTNFLYHSNQKIATFTWLKFSWNKILYETYAWGDFYRIQLFSLALLVNYPELAYILNKAKKNYKT